MKMSNIQKFITYGMVINVFFVIYLFRIINNYQLLAILLMFSIFGRSLKLPWNPSPSQR